MPQNNNNNNNNNNNKEQQRALDTGGERYGIPRFCKFLSPPSHPAQLNRTPHRSRETSGSRACPLGERNSDGSDWSTRGTDHHSRLILSPSGASPCLPAAGPVRRSRAGVANRAPSLLPSPREAERSPVSSVILSYGGLYHQFRRPGSGAASSIGSRDISAYLHETYTLAHPRVPPSLPPSLTRVAH